jgi:N-acetylmuramoyl-L-alanine amidase
MNRILALLIAISLLLAAPLAAQKKKSVLLKFNKEGGVLRIVFEGEEVFINKIKVTTSSSQIRMEFPEPFDLRSRKQLPFEIIPSEKMVVINLQEKSEIKFFRLSAPARLVIDIHGKESQDGNQTDTLPGQQPPAARTGKIVIDAGHGGYDFGLSYGSLNEKDINLALARELGTALKSKGKKVFLVRRADLYVSISDRIQFVNQKTPDIFISLHASMSGNFVLYDPLFDEQGSDDYRVASSQKTYAGRSKMLSDSIEKAIKDEFKDEVIRRRMPLPLLHSVSAPSVFLEYPSPRIVSYDQGMKTRLIQAIINGITVYGL